MELRGLGSHSLTFRDSGRARRVDKNGCGWSEIVASGVGARRAMIRLHLQLPYAVGPTGRPPQRSNPVKPHIPAQPEAIPTGCPDCFGAAVVCRLGGAVSGWDWIQENPMVHPFWWLKPDLVPPSPFFAVSASSHAWWFWCACRSGQD